MREYFNHFESWRTNYNTAFFDYYFMMVWDARLKLMRKLYKSKEYSFIYGE